MTPSYHSEMSVILFLLYALSVFLSIAAQYYCFRKGHVTLFTLHYEKNGAV